MVIEYKKGTMLRINFCIGTLFLFFYHFNDTKDKGNTDICMKFEI